MSEREGIWVKRLQEGRLIGESELIQFLWNAVRMLGRQAWQGQSMISPPEETGMDSLQKLQYSLYVRHWNELVGGHLCIMEPLTFTWGG